MGTDRTTADRADGFHRRLGMGDRPAVIVVDLCRAYVTPDSPLDLGRPEVADACATLVAAARDLGHPVVWTRVEFPPGGDGGVFYRKVGALACFDRGNPLADWVPGVEPAEGEVVVRKRSASSFFGTDLADRLRFLDVDTVVLCGVSTSGCVRATAVDACQHDLVPIVVADACADRRITTHEENLADLDAKYADVESLDHVVAEFRRLGRPDPAPPPTGAQP